jgi:hypothetical protein
MKWSRECKLPKCPGSAVTSYRTISQFRKKNKQIAAACTPFNSICYVFLNLSGEVIAAFLALGEWISLTLKAFKPMKYWRYVLTVRVV